jgi:hypothetical protein
MSTARNGQQQGYRKPTRRLRFDDLASIVARDTSDTGLARAAATAETAAVSHSGRRFVVAAGVSLLLISSALYLAFHNWRARYRERAAYGANQVVPALRPMAAMVPPDVDPVAWRDAVSQTRAMLLTVTGSNLLTIKEMISLRAELDQVVARASPATALRELASVWDAMGDRAEFLFKDSRSPDRDRHQRPRILPSYGATQVVPALGPLEAMVPPDVDPGVWHEAVSQTRDMLLMATDSNLLTIKKMNSLRAELEQIVARARAHPESAVSLLAGIWNQNADRALFMLKDSRSPGESPHPRPRILPPYPKKARARPAAGSRSTTFRLTSPARTRTGPKNLPHSSHPSSVSCCGRYLYARSSGARGSSPQRS